MIPMREDQSPVLNLLIGDSYQLSEDFSRADTAYLKTIRLAPNWAKLAIS